MNDIDRRINQPYRQKRIFAYPPARAGFSSAPPLHGRAAAGKALPRDGKAK